MEDWGSKPPINVRHTRIYCAGLRGNGNGNGRIKIEIRRSEIDLLYTREATSYLGRGQMPAEIYWNGCHDTEWISSRSLDGISKLPPQSIQKSMCPALWKYHILGTQTRVMMRTPPPPVHHPPPSTTHKSTCLSSLGTAPSVHQTSLPFVEGRETNAV